MQPRTGVLVSDWIKSVGAKLAISGLGEWLGTIEDDPA